MADILSPACRGLHDRLYIFISVCPIEICSSPWQMSLSPLPSLTDPWGLARLSPVIAQEEGPLLIGRPVMVGTPSDFRRLFDILTSRQSACQAAHGNIRHV